uniref:Uncharacterized protein n=1 Tax=Panagrellus redivivus TaxID=6233 RepID=A0A7E4VL63_PANRE
MSSPSSTSTNSSVPYQIFIIAAPVIVMLMILVCCMKLILVYFMQTRQSRESRAERGNYPGDVPSNVSITILRSPFAELFQQSPPPPSYEESAKQARDQRRQCQVNRAYTFESTESGPPPADSQGPPAYSETASATATASHRTDA